MDFITICPKLKKTLQGLQNAETTHLKAIQQYLSLIRLIFSTSVTYLPVSNTLIQAVTAQGDVTSQDSLTT